MNKSARMVCSQRAIERVSVVLHAPEAATFDQSPLEWLLGRIGWRPNVLLARAKALAFCDGRDQVLLESGFHLYILS